MEFTVIVKFVALFLTGLFGSLGIVFETKDKTTGKLTRWGKWALYVAIISGSLSVVILVLETVGAISSARAAADAARQTQVKLEKISNDASETLRSLEIAREEAGKSAKNLSDQQAIISETTQSLEKSIRVTAEESGAQLRSVIRSSGAEVAGHIRSTQAAINTSVNSTREAISQSVAGAEKGIKGSVEDTSQKIKGAVEQAVGNSSNLITTSTQKAITEQTRNIGVMARDAVADQIMRIPLMIEQDSERRLGGPLADILVTVGDVGRNKKFKVMVKREGDEKALRCEFIIPNKNNKAQRYPLSFIHPKSKCQYQLEMFIQTQTNLFGSGLDYLILRVVEERCPLSVN